jgi:hypothetical protein
MRLIAVVLLMAGSTAWAQRVGSATGFGRIANPGGAVTTTGGAGFGRIIYPGTGAPAAVRSQTGNAVFTAVPPPVNHGIHATPLLVPYPVFYGGGYYNYDAPPAQMAAYPQYGDPNQSSPVVIINQYFRPETANPVLHDYTDVPLPEGVSRGADGQPTGAAPRATQRDTSQDNQPIMFLIAMKDHTIYPALAYWVEGDTLNYITTQGTKNSASLDAVDRPFSQQLNKERKVDFGLPEKK